MIYFTQPVTPLMTILTIAALLLITTVGIGIVLYKKRRLSKEKRV